MTRGEIRTRLKALPGWSPFGQTIHKKFAFNSFLEAIEFVNRVAAFAEQAGHHPQITVNYNMVTLRVSTQDGNGLTPRDFDFARELDRLEAAHPD